MNSHTVARTVRSRCALVIAALLVLVGAVEASAATTGTFEFSPSEGLPGSDIAVRGSCLLNDSAEGVRLQVSLEQQSAVDESSFEYQREFTPDADGTVRATLTIPRNAPADSYLVYGFCIAGGTVFYDRSAPFVVRSATKARPPDAPIDLSTSSVPGATTNAPSTTEPGSSASPDLDNGSAGRFGAVTFVVICAALALGWGLLRRRRPLRR